MRVGWYNKSMKQFYRLLINTLIANVTTSYLWFALTFWLYLETKSVLATAIVGGSYMLLVAFCGLLFGTFVDKNYKKRVMVWSSTISVVAYMLAGGIYLLVGEQQLAHLSSPWLWLFASVVLVGAVVENLRNIALSTTVTIMVPKAKREKANGLIGSVSGVAFLVTSVLSGLSIGYLGLGWTMTIATSLTVVALLHLLAVRIPEKKIVHDPALAGKHIDVKGAVSAISQIPGLWALMLFSIFNNLIGGVFMALMDPYGLTLFSVQMWGVMLAVTSVGFIVGGLVVAKTGFGSQPLKVLLLVNIATSFVGMFFTIRELAWLYVFGIFIYMTLMPIAQAAEQVVLQRIVPLAKQGRVFGLKQSLEAAAAPLTAFVIGPLAQFIVIPYMRGQGQQDFAWLLGYGEMRGIALIFICASLAMLVLTVLAFRSRSYHVLTKEYDEA
jgi:MFS transporter, DHA3 family, multidrug efflux protein